jgi:predicted DNA-binding ribbon-helix-helix protein
MVRTQIQFPEDDWRRLRRMAREQNVSVSELVRRQFQRATETAAASRAASYARAASLCGSFQDRGSATDISTEHDRYLEEASG